jgi:hypothetical protein
LACRLTSVTAHFARNIINQDAEEVPTNWESMLFRFLSDIAAWSWSITLGQKTSSWAECILPFSSYRGFSRVDSLRKDHEFEKRVITWKLSVLRPFEALPVTVMVITNSYAFPAYTSFPRRSRRRTRNSSQ